MTFTRYGNAVVSGSCESNSSPIVKRESIGNCRGVYCLKLRGHDFGVTFVQLDNENIPVSSRFDQTKMLLVVLSVIWILNWK